MGLVIPAGARERAEPGPRGRRGRRLDLGPGYFADAKFRDDSREHR
jgi:hypothetical protein